MEYSDINTSNWSAEDWETFLNNTEGNVDEEIGITKSDTLNHVNSILNLNDLFEYISGVENSNNVRISIDDIEKSITIYDTQNLNIVGEIKPGNYSYNGLEKAEHMFHVINEPYKGKGLGKLLLEVYGKFEELNYKGFKLPKNEYNHLASMINLLSSYGYYVSGKYLGGEFFEISDIELFELFKSIDGREVEDDNLGVTYKLSLNK